MACCAATTLAHLSYRPCTSFLSSSHPKARITADGTGRSSRELSPYSKGSVRGTTRISSHAIRSPWHPTDSEAMPSGLVKTKFQWRRSSPPNLRNWESQWDLCRTRSLASTLAWDSQLHQDKTPFTFKVMPVVMLEMSRYAQNTNFALVVKLEILKWRCVRCAPNFTQVVKLDIRSRYALNTASDSHWSQDSNMPMQRSNGTRATLCLIFWHWGSRHEAETASWRYLPERHGEQQLAPRELAGFGAWVLRSLDPCLNDFL